MINSCYGGFGLSERAYDHMGLTWEGFGSCCRSYHGDDGNYWFQRDLKLLVDCVEELGDEASGGFAQLRVVEIPADVEWEVEEYDGWERIHEQHRSWG